MMTEYRIMNLIGAEDAVKASRAMQAAANQMQSVVVNLESLMFQQQQFMTEWIERFEEAISHMN